MFRVHRSIDRMTLDQIDRALDGYSSKPPGKMTPADADRMRELRMARQRIVGRDQDYWW